MICVVGTRGEKSPFELLALSSEVIENLKASELKEICTILNIEYTSMKEVKKTIKKMLKE